MQLRSNTNAITRNVQTPFQAIGGTEPYTYTVVSGGVGGTIDEETGLYTAPSTGYGKDTILATDADDNEATLEIRVMHPLLLLCDIIQSELQLSDGLVWLFDQKVNKPIGDQMYIVIQEMGNKVYGNHFYLDDAGNSVQYVNMQSMVQIDVMSKSLDSLYRKEEVVMALLSEYSEQQQEINSFKIASIPTGFVNVSQLDGNAIPYRYNITIQMLYSMQKSKPVEYYDEFNDVEVIPENSVSDGYLLLEGTSDENYLLLDDGERLIL